MGRRVRSRREQLELSQRDPEAALRTWRPALGAIEFDHPGPSAGIAMPMILVLLAAGASACTADFNALFDGGASDGARDTSTASTDGMIGGPDTMSGPETMSEPDSMNGSDAMVGPDTLGGPDTLPGDGATSDAGTCEGGLPCCLGAGAGGAALGCNPNSDTPVPCCGALQCTNGGSCRTSCLGAGVTCSPASDLCCDQGPTHLYCAAGGKCAACITIGNACTTDTECCSGNCQHGDAGNRCGSG